MTREGISPVGRRFARWAATSLVIVAGFMAFALAGEHVAGGFTMIEMRPILGLALACLILGGARLAPTVWIGTFVVSVVFSGGEPAHPSHLYAASAVTAMAMVGAWATRRFVGAWNPFASCRGVLRYAATATGLAILCGAFQTALDVALGVPFVGDIDTLLLEQILGDLASFLVTVPLLVILARAPPPQFGAVRAVEMMVLLGLLLGVSHLGFGPASNLPVGQNLLVLLLIPLSLWAALRHGQWGAVIAVVIVVSVASWGARYGLGAFVEEGRTAGDLTIKAFVVVVSFSAHVLAGVLAELARSREDLELRVAERTRERDRLLVEERAARAAAEESIRVRDNFLSVASHELKTPLTSLQLHLQSILRASRLGATPVSGPLERKVETASRQVKRVALLVDELLDVSRITANRLVLEPQELDLVQAVHELRRRFTDDFTSTGSPVHVSLGPPVLGHWDPLRLEQVLSNLMANALKYGAGQPIEIAVTATEDEATFSITDHGIGIAADDRDRIFERFQRAAPGTYGGLGLGLWIVRQIVEAMGGTVTVASEPGQGSTFVVRLPRGSGRERLAAG